MESTAPLCMVIGCERLSALTDVTRGKLCSYHAHYCSDCYMRLLRGERLEIDPSRLILLAPGEDAADGTGRTKISISK